MGKVVEMRRNKCPCGWEHPENVRVVVDLKFLPYLGELQYTCPRCGTPQAHDLKAHHG